MHNFPLTTFVFACVPSPLSSLPPTAIVRPTAWSPLLSPFPPGQRGPPRLPAPSHRPRGARCGRGRTCGQGRGAPAEVGEAQPWPGPCPPAPGPAVPGRHRRTPRCPHAAPGSARGPGGAALRALVSVAAGLLACGGASEYDYVSYQSDLGPYPGGRFYAKPHQCVAIPADLRLCHSVGYDKMVLPNLLDHETMAEVKHQASSWVPLLNKNCHMGTQVFLCSLFAPVCLDRPVYPCRWLCEAVRDSCEPVMQFFGFFWPEMLKCDQFPQDDVCIAMTTPNATEVSRPKGTTVCPPCDNEMKSEAIVEHLCASEFALKMTIKEVKKENEDKMIIPRKRKALKLGPIRKKNLKKLVLFLKNGADCPCHQLDNLGHYFLIMGRQVKTQYLLTAIYKWDKKNKEFKKFMKKMKSPDCPTFPSVFK